MGTSKERKAFGVRHGCSGAALVRAIVASLVSAEALATFEEPLVAAGNVP
jgi:hypothetical protein